MAGQLPLAQAVAKANLHTAEQLVIHGARTDMRINGMDFFEFVRNNYGAAAWMTQEVEAREAAAARLLQLAMGRRLADRPVDPSTQPSPRRRRAHV